MQIKKTWLLVGNGDAKASDVPVCTCADVLAWLRRLQRLCRGKNPVNGAVVATAARRQGNAHSCVKKIVCKTDVRGDRINSALKNNRLVGIDECRPSARAQCLGGVLEHCHELPSALLTMREE
jgi:hypothetical protein